MRASTQHRRPWKKSRIFVGIGISIVASCGLQSRIFQTVAVDGVATVKQVIGIGISTVVSQGLQSRILEMMGAVGIATVQHLGQECSHARHCRKFGWCDFCGTGATHGACCRMVHWPLNAKGHFPTACKGAMGFTSLFEHQCVLSVYTRPLAINCPSNPYKPRLAAGNHSLSRIPSKNQQLSWQESLGFVEEPDEQWVRRKWRHARQMSKESATRSEFAKLVDLGRWLSRYEPSFGCELKERIGELGDGGKWVCNVDTIKANIQHGEQCLVYSVGSNGQVDFEQSIHHEISAQCEVHVFDPADWFEFELRPNGSLCPPSFIQYHPWALGTVEPAKSMADIVQELGHTGRKIDLLKIDCEGCEWSTYRGWFAEGVDIRQILVELHGDLATNELQGRPATSNDIQSFFSFLFEHGYVIFHKEPTLGWKCGSFAEFSFLKLDPRFRDASSLQHE